MATGKAVAVATEEVKSELQALFPQAPQSAGSRPPLPRLLFKGQDVMTGTGKAKKVDIEAGTFFTDKPVEGQDEWEKLEIGMELEGKILYHRRQLSMYDEATGSYTSGPVFDTDEDVFPIWSNKVEVAKGTAKELQAMYEEERTARKTGKTYTASNLEENTVLYVEYEGTIYQLTIRGTSQKEFRKYAKTTNIPTVMTKFFSEARSVGTTDWNCMMFSPARDLTAAEMAEVMDTVKGLIGDIAEQKAAYANAAPAPARAEIVDPEFDALAAGK